MDYYSEIKMNKHLVHIKKFYHLQGAMYGDED